MELKYKLFHSSIFYSGSPFKSYFKSIPPFFSCLKVAHSEELYLTKNTLKYQNILAIQLQIFNVSVCEFISNIREPHYIYWLNVSLFNDPPELEPITLDVSFYLHLPEGICSPLKPRGMLMEFPFVSIFSYSAI